MFKSKQIILFLVFLINLNLLASDNKKQQSEVQTNSSNLLNQVTDILNIQKIITQYFGCVLDFESKINNDRALSVRLFPNQNFIVLNNSDNEIFLRELKENNFYQIPGQYTRVANGNNQLALVNNALTKENKIRFWDLQNLKFDKSFDKFINITENITSLIYSRDFKYLACGTNNGVIHIFDLNNKALLIKIKAHDHNIYDKAKARADITALDFSPNGKYLASGGVDESVKVWDFRNKENIYQFYVEQIHSPNKILFSENSELLACLVFSDYGIIYAADLKNLQTREFTTRRDFYDFLFINGQLIIIAENNKLIYYDTDQVDSSLKDINSFNKLFSQDGKLLAIASTDRYLYIFKNRAHTLLEEDSLRENRIRENQIARIRRNSLCVIS